MQLKQLSLIESKVTDLSALKGMKLEQLGFTPQYIKNGMDVIRQMHTLKNIHVFWKPQYFYDADDFWRRLLMLITNSADRRLPNDGVD